MGAEEQEADSWPVTHARLCDKCQHWSRWELLTAAETAHNNFSYDHLRDHNDCLVCRLVFRAVHARLDDSFPGVAPHSGIQVQVAGPTSVNGGAHSYPGWHPDWDVMKTRCTGQSLVMELWVHIQITLPEVGPLLAPGGNPATIPRFSPQLRAHYTHDGTLANIEDWDVPYIDLSTVKSWLQSCQQDHGAQCTGSLASDARLPPGFRLIDTISRSIVTQNTPVSFVALSYMWSSGGTNDVKLQIRNMSTLATPGSLTEGLLPGIIWDAICLCRDLGERYLWVDRFCIVQDDDSKLAQIAAMDLIYRSASFTIAVALNSRAGSGIPGYGNTPRRGRSSIFRPPLDFNFEIVKPNGQESLVDPSTWNRRGWTFQERILSKRILFVTEYQALFQCSLTTADEEFSWVSSCPRLLINGSTQCSFPQTQRDLGIRPREEELFSYKTPDNPELPTIKSYNRWVEDYSCRQLSFGTDILAAFNGVANVVGAGFACRMLFGLPERFLPQCLMWTTSCSPARRGDLVTIPSWSWASCAVPIDYHWDDHIRDRDAVEICSIVQYYYQDPDEGLRALQTEDRWMDQATTIKDLSTSSWLPPIRKQKFLPGETRSNLRWRACVHSPWEAALHTEHDPGAIALAASFPGSLVFNTTVASLYIENNDFVKTTTKNLDTQEPFLSNVAGERIGRLSEMSGEWVRARQSSEGNKKRFDIVVVCGGLAPFKTRKTVQWMKFAAAGKPGPTPEDPYDQMWRLCVMLVERLPCKPFVARRVDIGWVEMWKWNTCNPRWETVVIC